MVRHDTGRRTLSTQARPRLNPAAEGYTITADANIIHVRATLNYRITDPLKYSLNFVTASNAVQNALDNAIVFVSARTKVDDALRLERLRFQESIQSRVRELIEQQASWNHHRYQHRGCGPSLGRKRQIRRGQFSRCATGTNRAKGHRRGQPDDQRRRTEANNLVNLAQADATRNIEGLRADARSFLDQLQYLHE